MAMARMTTVVVADSRPLFRTGLIRALREPGQFDVVGDVFCGREAVEMIVALRPDVLVIGPALASMQAPEVAAAVRSAAEVPTAIVVLAASIDGADALEALVAGAAAFLPQDTSARELCDAVAAVARGEHRITRAVEHRLIGALHERGAFARPTLTERERQVLALTAEGLDARTISVRLHLSRATVKTHLQRSYEKLGVNDRAAAVAVAVRRGYIT